MLADIALRRTERVFGGTNTPPTPPSLAKSKFGFEARYSEFRATNTTLIGSLGLFRHSKPALDLGKERRVCN
jgi:hypothetical protein